MIGILNLTPDSFSDGGQYNQIGSALKRVKSLLKAGCKIVDVGGESTRPGSKDIDENIEWKRIKNLLKKIKNYKFLLSLDTRKTFVMRNALKYKLDIVNDVSGFSYDTKTIDFLKKTIFPLLLYNYSQWRPFSSNLLLKLMFYEHINYLTKLMYSRL